MNESTITILFVTLFSLTCITGLCQCASTSTTKNPQVVSDVIPGTWLKGKTTVADAEKKNLVSDERLGDEPVPFGFINDKWEDFKAGIRAGDEIWEFVSPSETWDALAGRAGFCIVRKDRIIDAFYTLIN